MALAAAIAWPASDADAICGVLPEVSVWPSRAFPAPVDTHVFLSLDAGFSSGGVGCGSEQSEACTHADTAFELRSAPSEAMERVVVPLTSRGSVSGLTAFLELTPDAPLDPNRWYEVWRVDRNHRTPALVLGRFATGSRTDAGAPDWQGILKASMYKAPPPGRIRLVDECGEPRLSLSFAAPTDAVTPAHALLAAIWITSPRQAIDYTTPPLVYERLVVDGSMAYVSAGNADHGEDDDLPIIDGKSPFRVGVRIVNLAGHASSPSEIVLY